MAYTPKDLRRCYVAYIADDAITYELATSTENAVTVNGGTPLSSPGEDPAYPRGWVPRHVYGFNAAGPSRTKVPILDPANGLWTGGTDTFTKDGIVYQVEGRIGEKRTYKGG